MNNECNIIILFWDQRYVTNSNNLACYVIMVKSQRKNN